jgi:hypothetical protein
MDYADKSDFYDDLNCWVDLIIADQPIKPPNIISPSKNIHSDGDESCIHRKTEKSSVYKSNRDQNTSVCRYSMSRHGRSKILTVHSSPSSVKDKELTSPPSTKKAIECERTHDHTPASVLNRIFRVVECGRSESAIVNYSSSFDSSCDSECVSTNHIRTPTPNKHASYGGDCSLSFALENLINKQKLYRKLSLNQDTTIFHGQVPQQTRVAFHDPVITVILEIPRIDPRDLHDYFFSEEEIQHNWETATESEDGSELDYKACVNERNVTR